MKFINVFVGTVAIALAGASFANDPWYVGAFVTQFELDDERSINDDYKTVNTGLQIGKAISENAAIELGYGLNTGHDDLDILSINALMWLGEDSSSWRPYLLGGFNQYKFSDTGNLVAGHDDRTSQFLLGVGLSKQFSGDFEFRADLRGARGIDESVSDFGVQLSLNKWFGRSAAPVAAAVVAAAPVVAEPAVTEPVVAEPEVRTITVRLNVEFEFNQDTVLAIYGDQLDAIAAAMKAHDDIDLILEGHSDSRGSDDYNLSLSDRRAKAVKAKLVADYGIPAERVSAMGYGETQPIATNDTDEGRARNRRVVGEMSFSEVFSF